MYFKKLEIIGFKSFFNKTVLNFEPGVTAVVGPNGCGKSNIFDSIRWVLGEQSVKALRGSQMEDVIFNGTEKKEPLGMAEVTLTFDNQTRHFSVDHHEVAITRRIFRSGESEYLLNKAVVRLKDILDLLMGTGIGAESYSLIQQGKIDLVLSSKPEDRRLVFDEASGISKYKSQKRETMRRLEETSQNLLRVNDIITEVKRQISSLERQASKARRYKEAFEELKSKEVSLAILQKKSLVTQKEEETKKLNLMQEQENQLLEAIKDQESKISSRQSELKGLEESIMRIKDEIMSLNNQLTRNSEHIQFNRSRMLELEANKKVLESQIEQTKSRITLDEEKLNKVREEYKTIENSISEKSTLLQNKEGELNNLTLSIKASLERISKTRGSILDVASRISNAKNAIGEISSKQQVNASREKRLELEKAKTHEERATVEFSLGEISKELEGLEANFADLNQKISAVKNEAELEKTTLAQIKSSIEELERKKLTLESQKQFLEQLRTKYEDIGESMNATIYLDKLPAEKLGGLVIKIKEYPEVNPSDGSSIKLTGEAKPIDLDTQRITELLSQIEQGIASLNNDLVAKVSHTESLNSSINQLLEELRSQEINLANKRTYKQNIEEQLNKIKNEEEIIVLELADVQTEVTGLKDKLVVAQEQLTYLDSEQKQLEDSIAQEQNSISLSNIAKEDVLVIITQAKTELFALQKRISSDAATLKILEDSYQQDKDTFQNLENQIKETGDRYFSLEGEIKSMEESSSLAKIESENKTAALKESQDKYSQISESISDVIKKIEEDRAGLDELKNQIYNLQMQTKDVDFKYQSIKDRILQGYKVDLDSLVEVTQELNLDTLEQEIDKLKEKLDSYGSVNLVAIEEYDELKKRYDFLTQQHTDLITAKDSLHEAILKINRTTKKMFLETFERVKEEFRNYFKLLFNGGDCQIYLLDENDPLESGIEIICRPPGKKLQNILLLSGGEKSMAAIALIFAIFKVKPAPFCVLDEIDAALDEANVDRFARLLQEFTNTSQFIVITHNKKTIANADVMYGITMEESGISKIVSVKFAQNKAKIEQKSDDQQILPEPAQETNTN